MKSNGKDRFNRGTLMSRRFSPCKKIVPLGLLLLTIPTGSLRAQSTRLLRQHDIDNSGVERVIHQAFKACLTVTDMLDTVARLLETLDYK
jgi:hypothetical protein